MAALKITSPAFSEGESIPEKYTADGDDVNPELNIEGIPSEAKSLVLIVDDPDAPAGTWTHWLVFNISSSTSKVDENSIPGIQGINDFKRIEWGGPSPPSGNSHRYFFGVYALDTMLELDEGVLRADIERAMQGHILTKGELIGRYRR